MPDDFELVFVQIGRHLCPEWYGVNMRSIDRWLDECGRDRLRLARREFVIARDEARREQRALERRLRDAIRTSAQADLTVQRLGGVGCGR